MSELAAFLTVTAVGLSVLALASGAGVLTYAVAARTLGGER